MSTLRVRRATLDDLATLRPMWESMRLNVSELERRLTEFQIVEDANSKVLGGIGFQIAGRHANLHSEAFSDFALADAARPLLWQRMQALALNHGIVRLWTTEQSPFWKQCGFAAPSAAAASKLPPEWAAQASNWATLQLKDEDSLISVEKELAMFMQAEKQRTDRAFQQARTMKMIATGIAFILAIFVGAALFLLLRKHRGY